MLKSEKMIVLWNIIGGNLGDDLKKGKCLIDKYQTSSLFLCLSPNPVYQIISYQNCFKKKKKNSAKSLLCAFACNMYVAL